MNNLQIVIAVLLILIAIVIVLLRYNPRLDIISQDSCFWLVMWYDARLYPDGTSDRDYKVLMKLRNRNTDNYK